MTRTVSVFLGRSSSFNVRQTARNIGRLLGDQFDLHLVTTQPGAFTECQNVGFTLHAPVLGTTRRDEVSAIRSYIATNAPDVLTQIGDVPIYGNLISLFKDSETTFVCRYSGDLFYEYRLANGLSRIKLLLLKNGLGRLPLERADHAIAMGPTGKRRLIARGALSDDVSILPPPVDPARFQNPGPPDAFDPDRYEETALFVGRISRLKGVGTLERTIPAILDRRPELGFVLVGTPEYELDLPAAYEDRVTVVGTIPPDEIPSYYEIADVYVHPSLTEGVSRAVLEALVCETPVVARDVGDLASATSNLFDTDDEFVDLVAGYDSLTVDPATPFLLETLAPKYTEVFRRV